MTEMIEKSDLVLASVQGRENRDEIDPYINEIAGRLWSGHAAVMVGSGFSKNAIPNSDPCPDFPGWSQLGDLFYEKIHGRKPSTQIKTHCVPKLAEMVHEMFGRPTLNQLLLMAIRIWTTNHHRYI